MKWFWIALLLSGCQIKTLGGGSTTPANPTGPAPGGAPATGDPAPPTARYEGADGVFMPSFANQPRADVTDSIRGHHLTGKIIETGDTDPKYARDELVCGQSPEPVSKVPPDVTITIKYCNTFHEEKSGPSLVGLSVEEAKKRAVAAGFTGQIEVGELYEYDGTCKPDTVCRVDPTHWELNQEHSMHLMLNKKLKIMAPD